jgi:hypothetical protein
MFTVPCGFAFRWREAFSLAFQTQDIAGTHWGQPAYLTSNPDDWMITERATFHQQPRLALLQQGLVRERLTICISCQAPRDTQTTRHSKRQKQHCTARRRVRSATARAERTTGRDLQPARLLSCSMTKRSPFESISNIRLSSIKLAILLARYQNPLYLNLNWRV